MLIFRAHAFYHVLLTCHFIVCLDSSLAWMVVITCVQHKKTESCASYYRAAQEAWVTCSAKIIARVQHTKFDSHAAHCVSHASFD